MPSLSILLQDSSGSKLYRKKAVGGACCTFLYNRFFPKWLTKIVGIPTSLPFYTTLV